MGGVDRALVYYLAGLQPAARLGAFMLGTVTLLSLFFFLFVEQKRVVLAELR